MKHLMIMAVLLVAGCGKKSSSGPSCADAVNKAVAAMPGGPGGGGDEIKGKLRDIFTKHCTDDKWSADVIKCYATEAKDMQSMKACREKLTPDQQQAVMTDVRAAMMSAMGGGMGGPGMGGPPPGAAPAAGAEGGAMGGAGAPPAAGPAGGGPAPAGSAAAAGSAAP